MKVMNLSKELGINNKDLIDFFKSKGYSVSSHLQGITDEMEKEARDNFKVVPKKKEATKKVTAKAVEKVVSEPVKEAPKPTKTYSMDEYIPCRSIVPWKMVEVGLDRVTVYHWSGYGDVDYVTYRDLQAFKRKDILKENKIIIEDEELCWQWSRELGENYKIFADIEFPEQFFDFDDSEFRDLLADGTDTYKEVIKYTAINMIKNSNYPDLNKIVIIDEVLGTCIKEFL